MEEKKTNNNTEKDSSKKTIYELGFLIIPSITEEAVPAKVGDMREAIRSFGAEFIAEEYPRQIDLAYPMQKKIENKNTIFTSGYFGWFKFEIEADLIDKIKKMLDLDSSIIRFLIIKTVRESTLLRRSVGGVKKRIHRSEEIVGVVSTPEEIDKQIDALVTDTESVAV